MRATQWFSRPKAGRWPPPINAPPGMPCVCRPSLATSNHFISMLVLAASCPQLAPLPPPKTCSARPVGALAAAAVEWAGR